MRNDFHVDTWGNIKLNPFQYQKQSTHYFGQKLVFNSFANFGLQGNLGGNATYHYLGTLDPSDIFLSNHQLNYAYSGNFNAYATAGMGIFYPFNNSSALYGRLQATGNTTATIYGSNNGFKHGIISNTSATAEAIFGVTLKTNFRKSVLDVGLSNSTTFDSGNITNTPNFKVIYVF